MNWTVQKFLELHRLFYTFIFRSKHIHSEDGHKNRRGAAKTDVHIQNMSEFEEERVCWDLWIETA
jgi:hypothetical protein